MRSLRANSRIVSVLALVCIGFGCGRAVTDVSAAATPGSGGSSSGGAGQAAGGSGVGGGAGGVAGDAGMDADSGACKGAGVWRPISVKGLGLDGSAVVWTGTEMLVWGGEQRGSENSYVTPQEGMRYSPSKDTWSPIAKEGAPPGRAGAVTAWTGSEMLMWGGHLQSSAVGDGARYAPSTDTWKPIAAGGPSSRSFHAGVWTGERFILWGGLDGNARFGDGAGYDPKTDSWTPVSPAGAPEARAGHTAVWTGTQMLVWGGSGVAGPLSTGGRYDPATDAWQPISPAGAPTPRAHFTAVWTGHKLVVWGGYKELSSGEPTTYVAFGDGAAYDPGTDTWSPLSTVGAPEPRSWHAGVWTGTQMLIWGGARTDWTELVTGGLYDPAFDTWEATAECGAAIAHRGFDSLFDSVWTGNELIVFGGGSTGTAGAYTPP